MPSLSFRLCFHPNPEKRSLSGTFDSEAEFDAYKDFELKHTKPQLLAYWLAPPTMRARAADALEARRKAVYDQWKRLVKMHLPDGEIA